MVLFIYLLLLSWSGDTD